MGYDLAIWQGPRPRDDEAAGARFQELADAADAAYEADTLDPPIPAIRDLVSALLARWPGEPADDALAVWSTGHPLEDAHGGFVYLTMTFDGAEAAERTIVREAARRGLVCYDPQREMLLG